MSDAAVNLKVSAVNPYDFSNPVSTKDLFVGREAELRDILYYLEHAKSARRSINLALLGERAAGKTSLLNIVEQEARARSLVPVRVDLNEGDATSSLRFWFKLFDAVFTTLVDSSGDAENAPFGGPHGRTRDVYLDLIATYEIPSDKTFCPFQFPLHFARAMAANNPDALVPEQILRRDLSALATEAGKVIVILIDECNVLSASKTLLEMVRNTFMNLPGYMLVFTGTPSLFPVMDEVFSPIVRQFKRIAVSPFATVKETLSVVQTPLERIGQRDLFIDVPDIVRRRIPEDSWHMFDEQLKDLHRLTGGRPYEIQLVCHFMFKRIQLGKASKMELSYEVLADVLAELGETMNLASRQVLAAILRLPAEKLLALRVLALCDPTAGIRATLAGACSSGLWQGDPSRLSLLCDELIDSGIFRLQDGSASFAGDDFDRVFCKYAASRESVALEFSPTEPGEMIDQELLVVAARFTLVQRKAVPWRPLAIVPVMVTHRNSEAASTKTLDKVLGDSQSRIPLPELISHSAESTGMLYRFCIAHEAVMESGMRVIHIEFSFEGYHWEGVYLHASEGAASEADQGIVRELEAMRGRAETANAVFEFECLDVDRCSMDQLFSTVTCKSRQATLEAIAEAHAEAARDAFLLRHDLAAAITHATCAARLSSHLDVTDASNTAFLLLLSRRFQLAREVLAVHKTAEDFGRLARYNYAIACLGEGLYDESNQDLQRVAESEEGGPEEFIVLVVPEVNEGQLILREKWAEGSGREGTAIPLNLNACASDAIRVLQSLRQTHS